MRDKVASRELLVNFISTKDQLAEIFTKPLSGVLGLLSYVISCRLWGIHPALEGGILGLCSPYCIVILIPAVYLY